MPPPSATTGVFSLIVLAPLIYGLLYPQPYLGQLLRELPIAVVDEDHSELSRDFIQDWNADEALTVVAAPDDSGRGAGGAGPSGKCLGSSTSRGERSARLLKGNQARRRRLRQFGVFSAL